MIGRARTHGAITIVNALRTGIGAAIGVDLPVEVVARPTAPAPADRIAPGSSDTPIVRAAIRAARRDAGAGAPAAVALRVRSEVPPACGLKSSSAVAVAVYLAVLRSSGADPSAEPAARAVAEAARAAGQSATGAFDDNLAAADGGLWVTDNRRDRVLRHDPPERELSVVLWIPPGTHPPSPTLAEALQDEGPSPAVALALAGRAWEALEANAAEVEARLGLPPTDRPALRARGALAAGVSGLGPARAVVVPTDRARTIAEFLADRPGSVRTVGLAEASDAGTERA